MMTAGWRIAAMVEVYRRHWFWSLVGPPARAAVVGVLLIPMLMILSSVWAATWWVIAESAADLVRGRVTLATLVVGLALTLVLAPIVITRVRHFRRRIEIDHDRGMVRFVGFARWEPWWRPRLGPLEVPFEGIRHVERHAMWRGRYWSHDERPLRVIAGSAVIDIPPGMRRMRELEARLRAMAARTPGVPESMTERGFERLIAGGVWAFWVVGLGVVAFWLIPSVG
ncbi:MAG: hypothetical protein RIB60_03240 [Phycisphaerales bacterium]